jgi:uncharacterized protein YhaN
MTGETVKEDRADRDAAIEQRNTVETRHKELMEQYGDVIGGRPFDEVHEQFAEFRRKMTDHTRLLAQAAAGVAEEVLSGKVSKLEADHGAVRHQLDEIADEHLFVRRWQEDIHEVETFLETARRDLARASADTEERASKLTEIDRDFAVKKAISGADLPHLLDMREETGRRIEVLQKERDALYLAWRVLDESIEEFSQTTIELVCDRASELLGEFTGGRYARVDLDEQFEPRVSSEERDGIPPESLSTGACDQLFLALRVAFAEVLAGQEELPIILDDPFANFDSERLQKALQTLKLVAADRQIILLTHDRRTEGLGHVVARLA